VKIYWFIFLTCYHCSFVTFWWTVLLLSLLKSWRKWTNVCSIM